MVLASPFSLMDAPSRLPSVAFTPAKGTSLHRQVFLILRDQIIRGLIVPGGVMPKEEALCETFGVSRITVRRALADLAAQGFVERRQGLGTFVRRDVPQPRERPSLSYIEGLRKAAIETQVTVLRVEQLEAPREVAEWLRLGGTEKALHALRLRSIADLPVMLTDAWVPLKLGKRVTAAALRQKALYEILQSQGVELGRVVQEVTAVVANVEQAALLKTEAGSPLLKLVRLMHGVDARPVEYLTVYLCPERSRLLMDIPAEEVNTLGAGQIVHDTR
jgi:GntR family transcriptional regulator